jgi:hypothetical protein
MSHRRTTPRPSTVSDSAYAIPAGDARGRDESHDRCRGIDDERRRVVSIGPSLATGNNRARSCPLAGFEWASRPGLPVRRASAGPWGQLQRPVLGSSAMGVQWVADPQQSLSMTQNPPTPRQAQVPRGRVTDDARHWPPKQSAVVRLHPLSPAWALQVPPKTYPEQHPGLNWSVRATDPAGRHWHAPATHVPRAQSASVAQLPPSPARRHCPETHAPLQQSEDDRQAGPTSL